MQQQEPMTDPYKILGLSKTATLDDIKKAYRKLAKKYHPDLNPGSKEAEKKFKELSHAFDLIGTQESRDKFDRGETDEQRQHQYEARQKAGSNRYSSSFGNGYSSGQDPEDLFESLFGRARGRGGRGFSDARMDDSGEDELYRLDVEFAEAAIGGEKVVTLPNGKKLQVKIPAGIENGKKLKFKNMGGAGANGAANGDLYLEINILSRDGFTRVDQDIMTDVSISLFEAALGAEIEVPTIDGTVMLKVPAGVSSGSRLRIKNKGAGPSDSRGNQIVTLKVVMPKNTSSEFKEALGKLKTEYAYNPRKEA